MKTLRFQKKVGNCLRQRCQIGQEDRKICNRKELSEDFKMVCYMTGPKEIWKFPHPNSALLWNGNYKSTETSVLLFL